MSLCPSAWDNWDPTGRIFMKFDIWAFFLNLLRKFKFYENFTIITFTLHEDVCKVMAISRWLLLRMRNVWDKVVEKFEIHFVLNNFLFLRDMRLWDNVEKYGRARLSTDGSVWRMCFACWISKAINTHSEYVILLLYDNNGYITCN